jgi:N6-L-threonylcarbamoyladenine synthase
VADLAASFQAAAVEVLVEKCRMAVHQQNYHRLCVGGGVAANQHFRTELEKMAARQNIELQVAPLELCTDNAAMAAIAWELLSAGRIASLDADVLPGLVRHDFQRTKA